MCFFLFLPRFFFGVFFLNSQITSQKGQQFSNIVHPLQTQQQIQQHQQAQIQINCQPSSQANSMAVYHQPQSTASNMQILPSGIQTMPSPQITQQQHQQQQHQQQQHQHQHTANPDQMMHMQSMSTNVNTAMAKDPVITQPSLVLNNVNAPKLIELPKTAPNQQLFSLNTITNQITQLPPGLTTAALGPMERLLIVPAGVNKQQLAKCLIQGQIHFDNIGQATQLPDHYGKAVKSGAMNQSSANESKTNLQQQQQIPQPIIQRQIQLQTNQVNSSPTPNITTQTQLKQTAAQKAATLDIQNKTKIETKPKRAKPKKSKAETNKANKAMLAITKPNEIIKSDNENTNANYLQQSNANEMPKSIKSPKLCNPVQLSQNFSANQTNAMVNISTVNTDSKATLSMATQKAMQQASHQMPQPIVIDPSKSNNLTPQKNLTIAVNASQTSMPPLISVNQAQMVSPTHVPRVQTIQLTPQKQQSLKTVQMQIQTLSSRLQNKSLLSSIRPDLSPTNPLHNKPLPVLTNLNAMNDIEIYQALQRLFIEQQKILATGKVISTLPAAPNFSANISSTSSVLIPTQSLVSPVKRISIDKTVQSNQSISSNATPLPSINKLKTNYPSRSTQNVQPICIVSPQQQQQQQQQSSQLAQQQQQQQQPQKVVPTALTKCDVTTSTVISTPIVSTAVSVTKETVKLPSPKPTEQIPKVQTIVPTSTNTTSLSTSTPTAQTLTTTSSQQPTQKPLVPRTYL